MSKAVFIIATILISVALAASAIPEKNHRPHEDHKRPHSQTVGHHNKHIGQSAKHSRHHIQDLNKERINHGQMPVPLAPHHSKSHRNGRRHKTSKSSKPSRQQHAKPDQHKGHGHGRKHH